MDEILKYFPSLTDLQRRQFEAMGPLYREWNEKINVVSRRDIDNLYLHHILHSLAIAKFLTPADGTTILDVGTGGGFPGIPLAVAWPQCRLLLVDRTGKKIRVASEIAAALGLDNVEARQADVAEVKQRFDFVVSRAVMRLDELVKLVRKNVSPDCRNGLPNGLIALKGGELADEMRLVRCPVMELPLTDWFSEPFFETKKLIYVQL